jgi:uncharacterized phage-associated protein
MSLEKLIYYAQAFYFVLKDEPLFPDELKAWKWGPVIPGVYSKYATYGADPISLPSGDAAASLGTGIDKFLIEVVDFFCRHTAINLSRASHMERPWIEARESSDNTISQSSLKQFYGSLMDDGERALSRCELLDSAPEPRWSSLYVAGICWRKLKNHPFYDGTLAQQLTSPRKVEGRPTLPEGFYAPVKGRDFVEFTAEEDVDSTIRRVVS